MNPFALSAYQMVGLNGPTSFTTTCPGLSVPCNAVAMNLFRFRKPSDNSFKKLLAI